MEIEGIRIPDSLQLYAERFNRTLEELARRYVVIYKSLADREEKVRRLLSFSKVTNELRREEGVTEYTTDYKGIVLGATQPEDAIENSKRIAISIYNKDKNRAIEEKWTTEDGIPLDKRNWVRGQNNPNKGMPLEGEDWRRTIVGLATRANDGDYKFFTLQCYGKDAVNINVPLNTPVFFRAVEKAVEAHRMNLNTSSVTTFRPIEENIKIEEELRQKNLITPLKQVQEWYEYNKKTKGAILVTEGSVYRIRREPNERGRRSITLTEPEDPDTMQSFSVPEHIKLNFEEDSRVLAFGIPRKLRNRNALWIDTIGVFPLPGYLMPMLPPA